MGSSDRIRNSTGTIQFGNGRKKQMEIVMGGIHDLENRRFLYNEKDFMSEDDEDKLLTK